MDVGIKQTGKNTWKIDAVYKTAGKQFRERDPEFKGSERRAEVRRAELYLVAEKRGKSWLQRATQPITTFGHIIDRFEAANALPATAGSTLRRIKTDCSKWPVADLRLCLNGGVDSQQRPVRGYITLLDKMYVRKFVGYKTGRIVESPKLLSPGAKNKIVGMLKRITLWAYGQRLVPEDPLSQYARKNIWREVPRNKVWQQHVLQSVLNFFEQKYPEYVPLVLHCSRNPARISDMRTLTRENLFLLENKIRYISGKKDVPATHIIYPETADHFRHIPAACPWLFYRYIEKGDKYVQIGNFKKALQQAFDSANVPRGSLRWHDLRHYAATWLGARGVTTSGIMVIGGWKTRQMVERYHNLEHDQTADAAAAILLGTDKKQAADVKSA